jgi:MFS family permease
MEKNILKINIYALLCGMRFSLPIIFIDLKNRGFSFSQIGILFSIQAMASLICEIPAGSVADKYGTRLAMAISSTFIGITYFFLATESNYYIVCLLFALWGIAKAFHSGADTGFIVDTLKELKKENLISKVLGQKWSMFYLGLATSSLCSPLIILWGGEIFTYYGTVVSTLLATIVIMTGIEPNIDHSNIRSIKHVKGIKEYFKYVNQGISYLRKHSIIKYILIIAVSFSLGAQIFFQYVQEILYSFSVEPKNFGFYYTSFTATAALFSSLTYRVDGYLGQRNMIVFLVFLNSIVLLSLGGTFGSIFALASILGMQMQAGLSTSIMNHYLNEYIDSYNRATLNSFKTLLHGIMMFVLSPIIGLIADDYSVSTALVTYGVILAVITIGPVIKISQRVPGQVH